MKIVLYGGPVLGFEPELRHRLGAEHELCTVGYDAPAPALAAALGDARAMLTARFQAGLPPGPSLRLVQVPGVGFDEIDIAALPATATLCNVHGHGPAVAEYAVLAMLEWGIGFADAQQGFRGGSWRRSSRMGAAPHRELQGRVVGIVGYGHIGRSLSRRLAGFAVETLVCNRTPPAPEPELAAAYALDELPQMLARCDFVVVCIALTEATRGLIGERALAAMKSDAVVVNVARGPVIDEDALFAALASGRIGGAVIDVWYSYPEGEHDAAARPSRHDFSALPNVFMTPHISGWTRETVGRRLDDIVENLRRLEAGRPLINVVHPAHASAASPSGRF